MYVQKLPEQLQRCRKTHLCEFDAQRRDRDWYYCYSPCQRAKRRRKRRMGMSRKGPCSVSAGDVGREQEDYGGAVHEVCRAPQPGRDGVEGQLREWSRMQ
jgi:hypothetical protein